MTSLLAISDVCVQYAQFKAVDGVSLNLCRGQTLGIVGESGSGKSTLAKAILGLVPYTRGSIEFDGRAMSGIGRKALAKRMQPVFQDPYSSLNPAFTIGTTIASPLAVHGVGSARSRGEKVLQMLAQVGLPANFADRYPSQLSGGQRQRVAIARALVLEPELLVCDEPTSALDVSVQAQILNLLMELPRTLNLSMIFISHNLAVVEHIASNVAVMYRGQIVERNETAELFRSPRHPYTSTLLSAILTPDIG